MSVLDTVTEKGLLYRDLGEVTVRRDVDIGQQDLPAQRQGQPELGGDLAGGGGRIDAEVGEQVEMGVVEQGQDRPQGPIHAHTDSHGVTAAVQASNLNCARGYPQVGELSGA